MHIYLAQMGDKDRFHGDGMKDEHFLPIFYYFPVASPSVRSPFLIAGIEAEWRMKKG